MVASNDFAVSFLTQIHTSTRCWSPLKDSRGGSHSNRFGIRSKRRFRLPVRKSWFQFFISYDLILIRALEKDRACFLCVRSALKRPLQIGIERRKLSCDLVSVRFCGKFIWFGLKCGRISRVGLDDRLFTQNETLQLLLEAKM